VKIGHARPSAGRESSTPVTTQGRQNPPVQPTRSFAMSFLPPSAPSRLTGDERKLYYGFFVPYFSTHLQFHFRFWCDTSSSPSYRNSTAFIWHSSGVRCPPRRLPLLRTSSPSISRSPSSPPSAVSRSRSPRIGRPSRSGVSTTAARASRNSVSFTSLRSTRPQSLTPPCAWK
jgi:hypothetical protein